MSYWPENRRTSDHWFMHDRSLNISYTLWAYLLVEICSTQNTQSNPHNRYAMFTIRACHPRTWSVIWDHTVESHGLGKWYNQLQRLYVNLITSQSCKSLVEPGQYTNRCVSSPVLRYRTVLYWMTDKRNFIPPALLFYNEIWPCLTVSYVWVVQNSFWTRRKTSWKPGITFY